MTQLNFGGQGNLIENVKKNHLKNCIWNSQTSGQHDRKEFSADYAEKRAETFSYNVLKRI